MIWLRKIWNDSVGSKVIATGIIWLITSVSIWIYGLIVKISFKDAWVYFYNMKVPLFWVLMIVFTIWILRATFKKLHSKNTNNDSIYTVAQLELKKYNQKQVGNILWKWQVNFDEFEYEQPKIYDLQPYCTLHNTPLKMRAVSNYECPHPNCLNHFPISDMYKENPTQMKYIIESELEAMYENLLSK